MTRNARDVLETAFSEDKMHLDEVFGGERISSFKSLLNEMNFSDANTGDIGLNLAFNGLLTAVGTIDRILSSQATPRTNFTTTPRSPQKRGVNFTGTPWSWYVPQQETEVTDEPKQVSSSETPPVQQQRKVPGLNLEQIHQLPEEFSSVEGSTGDEEGGTGDAQTEIPEKIMGTIQEDELPVEYDAAQDSFKVTTCHDEKVMEKAQEQKLPVEFSSAESGEGDTQTEKKINEEVQTIFAECPHSHHVDDIPWFVCPSVGTWIMSRPLKDSLSDAASEDQIKDMAANVGTQGGKAGKKANDNGESKGQVFRRLPEGQKIWIGNLPESTTQKELHDLLEPAGAEWVEVFSRAVQSCTRTGGAGFTTAEQATAAISKFNGHMLNGSMIHVDVWTKKEASSTQTPRGRQTPRRTWRGAQTPRGGQSRRGGQTPRGGQIPRGGQTPRGASWHDASN